MKKHVAQAIVLLSEAVKGYPLHRHIAIGHLAEAEDECTDLKLASKIREIRIFIDSPRSLSEIQHEFAEHNPLLEMLEILAVLSGDDEVSERNPINHLVYDNPFKENGNGKQN